MKVLMISDTGDGLTVADKLTREGNEVLVWIKDPAYKKAGKGIVKRIGSWRDGLSADLVICDMVGFGHLEDTLRRIGKPTISCSYILEQAELDRTKGMRLFRSVGITIPDTYDCTNPKDASKIVESLPWEDGWVIKPSGNIDNAKTLMVKDHEELAWALGTIGSGPLIIQRVVSGVEVSTEGWFNGRDFIRPFNHTFEEKKFLNDDLGPVTGCMGNVVFGAPSNKLTRNTVERLKPFLSVVGYHGPVDVNCIVTKDAAYGLEITARMGYDAIDALLEGLREPAIDLFFECAQGTKKVMNLTRETMISVPLSVPPYPHAAPEPDEADVPIRGLTPEVLKHVSLRDVYLDSADKTYKSAGGDNLLLKANAVGQPDAAKGDFVREAQRRVYRTLKNISVSGKQYRTDVGARVDDDLRQLKEWGWV